MVSQNNGSLKLEALYTSYSIIKLRQIFCLVIVWICALSFAIAQDTITAPINFKLKQGDKLITVSWESKQNQLKFKDYKLERSDDKGKSWKLVNNNQMILCKNSDNLDYENTFIDSVKTNYKEFRYRLQGQTKSGEMSKFAELKGEAIDLSAPPTPQIVEARFNDTLQTANLRWVMSSIPDDFDGFYILMSRNSEGSHADTISPRLKASQLKYVYKPLHGFSGDESHYFQVMARDKKGNTTKSLERYMHVPDLIAPPPPDSVKGKIEDDGSVKINWSKSKAKDVIGYWVYFANDSTEEFRLLNTKPVLVNNYAYKVNDVSLNSVAYYMIAAEDKSNNRGKPSKILKLRRPDKVPPVKPDFFNPIPATGRITVNWKKSPSEDVAKYHVYRRIYGTNVEWKKIGIINQVDSVAFADTTVVMDVLYEYKIQAEDESGNLSEETLNFTSKLPFEPEKIKLNNFSVIPDDAGQSTKLKWAFTPTEKSIPKDQTWEFSILRSDGTKNVEFLTSVNANTFEFIDHKLEPGVLYNYAMQLKFKNGRNGELSPVKSVMIKDSSGASPLNIPENKKEKKGK